MSELEQGNPVDPSRTEIAAEKQLRAWWDELQGTFRKKAIAVAMSGGIAAVSAGGAVQQDGVLRWGLLGFSGVSLVISGIITVRSRLLRERMQLKRAHAEAASERDALQHENEALTAQVAALQELQAFQEDAYNRLTVAREAAAEREAGLEDDRDASIAFQQRLRVYASVNTDAAAGLSHVIRHPEERPKSLVEFIEDNSLRALAENFRAQLALQYGRKVEVEVAIAESDAHGFKVTHASGKHTEEMKQHGACLAVGKTIHEVAARKASAYFVAGGFHVVDMNDESDPGPRRHLLVLSSAPIGEAEKLGLLDHAGLILLTSAVLSPMGLE